MSELYKQATIAIDSVNVNNYLISLEINEVRNGIRDATVVLDHKITDYITVKNGLIVEIDLNYIGDTHKYKKFHGYINNIQDSISGTLLECVDDLWKCTGETITKVYKETDSYSGDPTKILIDLYDHVDIVADTTTIDPTSVVLPEITCDSAYVSEKIDGIVGALGWDQYYDPEDSKAHVVNSDLYATYSTPLVVGKNVQNLPEYNDNIYQTINEIELQGVSSDSAYKETFTGDGSTKIFTVTRTPLSTYIYVTVDGVEQKGSVDGASTAYDYLINKQQGFIEFATAPAAGKSIVVNYTATELTSVTVDDEDSQADHTKRKLVVSVTDAITIDDALERAKSMIKTSKNNFYDFSVNAVNVLDISCRNYVNFEDMSSNTYLNGLYVNKITWKWPEYYEVLQLGTKPFDTDEILYTTEQRVKKLERKRQEGQVLTINKISTGSMRVSLDSLKIDKISYGSTTNSVFSTLRAPPTIVDYSGSNCTWDCAAYTCSATGTLPDAIKYTGFIHVTGIGDTLDVIKDNNLVGIYFQISYTTSNGVAPEIVSASLLIDNQIVGLSSTNNVYNYASAKNGTFNIGIPTETFGLDLNNLAINKDGFGLYLIVKNNDTQLSIDDAALAVFNYQTISSTTTVADTKKYEKDDYDDGTVTTVSNVVYTANTDNTLQITGSKT